MLVELKGIRLVWSLSSDQGIEDSYTGRDSPGFPWTEAPAGVGRCHSLWLSQHLAFLSILSARELINPNEGCKVVIFHLPQEQAELLSDSVWSRKNWTGLCVFFFLGFLTLLLLFRLGLQLLCTRAVVLVGNIQSDFPAVLISKSSSSLLSHLLSFPSSCCVANQSFALQWQLFL